MPYLGNHHIVGDSVNNFKVLDDISTYTATFDGSATSVVSTANETIRILKHRFVQGQRVTYNNGGGSNIGGLTSGTAYYVIEDTAHTIKLATNASNAASLTAINLNAVGGGASHTLNAAFDGVNTKFRITHGSGNRPRFHHATQLNIAINNVIQRPNNSLNFTEGYAVEVRDIIVFKTAPTSNDIFFGSLTGETRGTFDIQDNVIDTHTADGSTTVFNLSQIAPNSQSLLVTLNGVVQHPTTAGVTGSYEVVGGSSNTIEFTTAPVAGVDIQIRHIGFAGASTGDVTGFYGRTGNVGLTTADNITVGDITATSADFSGNVSVGGVLTYEDVTNVDSVGVGTFRDGIKVGSGVTIEPNGNASFGGVGVVTFSSSGTTIYGQAGSIRVGTALTLGHTEGIVYHTQNLHSQGFEVNQVNASGIITASQFKGDGSELTGVSGFSTALSNDTTSLLNNVFKTSVQHNVAAGTSVTIQSDAGCGNIAFTRLDRINVGTGATLHIGAGTTFIMNVLKVFS
ncbi:MAG: hypothetical protein CMG35_08220 [Candidatus Marinimicrobia bacterium]|nr:hypothetical protein [Candidatus Neomarinimicrobiota bacterium]|tara:strand:- start:3175 stop:4713 length:1539 start_codon:yes stop_codon:yes gene_type:complete